MQCIQNPCGFKALSFPFKSAINIQTIKFAAEQAEHNKKVKTYLNVFLPVWDNVEDIFDGTRSPRWPIGMVPAGSWSHQAMISTHLESAAKGAHLPLFPDSSTLGIW